MNDDPIRVENFRAIYSAHHRDLWRYCLRRTSTPAEAEDVLGDVFTVAWRRLDDVPAGEAARPWLFGVARNHLHNHRRRSNRSHDLHLRLVSETTTSAAAAADRDDEPSVLVLEALGQLCEADAEILRLAVWEELPHRQIATVMDCSENAVAIRIHRARKRLAEHLRALTHDDHADAGTTPTPTAGDRNEGDRNV